MSLSNEFIKAIIELDEEKAIGIARRRLEVEDPTGVINDLKKVAEIIGEMYEKEELYLADLIIAGDIMKVISGIVREKLVSMGKQGKVLGRVVIGTVEGDIHDIGKNLVAIFLEAAGFEVIDLGVDVSPQRFVEAIKQYNPDVVGMSALMTTTMAKQKETIEFIKGAGLRDKVRIVVGGAPTTEEWAKEIGADGWAPDAVSAVELIKRLLGLS